MAPCLRACRPVVRSLVGEALGIGFATPVLAMSVLTVTRALHT
jgi:hypothetical protein